MRALILAGGRGTRLQPLTDHVSKSLLPIANVPFLEHQVRSLAAHGITEATLLTGYRAEDFPAFTERAGALGVSFEIRTESEPLGTAGALRGCLDVLEGTFLVLNSDVLTDIDISALLAQHRSSGACVTMALSRVDDAGGYGVVPLEADGRVRAFVQNPPGESRPGDWINAGIYAMEPGVLERVPPGAFSDLERPPGEPLFPGLVAAGEPFFGFRSPAYWIDIGTPERYRAVHADILAGRTSPLIGGTFVDATGRVDHGMVQAPSIVGTPVLIGPGAIVGPRTCVGNNVLIGGRARVEDSVVHDDVRIGVGATVRNAILGRGARVPVGARIEDQVIAGQPGGD